eukprot:TRINITY_DN7461_c0_g2_i10.p1 TRINITY_DN7461_c0_g2~~TRINITY_DN7461_c0_g2_i10.p1  ORF type:complete len:228 (-),score=41.47 TRINITY_DN7461_c0_g2_i10:220-903(-)
MTNFTLIVISAFLAGLSVMILFVLPLLLPHSIDVGLFSLPIVIILFPVELFLLDILILILALFLKLLLIGRFEAGQDCHYGTWRAFRRAVVISLPRSFHLFSVLAPETPLMVWLHRIFGVNVGKNVLFRSGTIHVDEFDLGTIGDNTVLELYAGLQTHTSENRVFKFAPVLVGANCVMGCATTIMPYQHVDHHVEFKPLTCGFPGEYFPPHTTWAGVPPVLIGKETA